MLKVSRLAIRLSPLLLLLGSPTSAAGQVVHAVYLVPADRTFREDYRAGVEMAALDMQAFYQAQLQFGRTFRLDPNGVMVLHSTHEAAWFSTNVGPGGSNFNTFYANVRADVEAILGRPPGSLHAGPDVWALHVDARHACGQCGGCGGNRVIVGGRNDLRGLVGESFEPVCPTDRDTSTRCRFVGGLGHELGHAFGLPHPTGCDEGLATCDWNAMMWAGYAGYPTTYLRADEKSSLLATNYIASLPPLSSVAVCGPVPPSPPGLFSAEVAGPIITFAWTVPQEGGAPTSYTLRAGSAPGLSNLASLNIVGPTTTFQAEAPPGTYYLRLVARNQYGLSAASDELRVVVGVATSPPAAPTGFDVQVQGRLARLSWNAPAAATGYVLEAGTVRGAANLAVIPLGPQTSFTSPALSPGVYYVRVKATNAAGVSPASNEVELTVSGPPGPPTALTVRLAGRVATLSWTAPAGAVSGYLLEAGTVPGATNLGAFALGQHTTFVSPILPPGIYYVRVKTRNDAGTSPASNEVQIHVPTP